LTPSEAHWQCSDMSLFRTPQIVLFTQDIDRASAFYQALGFEEVFRTPLTGTPIHVDFALDGYRIGLATEASTRDDHGLDPVAAGQRAAVILWTDDVPTGYERLIELGATPVKPPEPWLDRLLIAWVEDLDGHLVQVVQNVS
jgi:catechol 2,3-dioxygenase-like lactoylglutathione lyase family enzyme